MEYASKIFNNSTTDELGTKIQPHYLGVDSIDIPEKEFDGKMKTILFNSRDDSYTGFSWFIEEMDKLWQKRKDFKVITTIANTKRPYLEKVSYPNRQSYLDAVKECYIHVGCFEQYSAWSIATTDALSRGVPSILPNDFCYPEMLDTEYPFLYKGRKEFVEKLVYLLDCPWAREQIKIWLSHQMPSFLWSNRIPNWFSGWKFLDGPWKCVGDKSESYREILKTIKAKKQVTKKSLLKQLSWGRGIPFSDYRNRLRADGIKTLRNGYKI
jgi:glycosyltransferase involved in cell wall biosynthesis